MRDVNQSGEQPNVAYLQSYATLINQKLLVPSASSSYLAVQRYFLAEVLAPLIAEIDVDERWYLTQNPDVREAITRGTVKDARQHYIQYGFLEHRLPYRVRVEEDWYMTAYPDVKEAILSLEFSSAQAHFEASGYREGRLPFPSFALLKSLSRAA